MSVLDTLTSQSDTLIRAEVIAAAERSALERGIWQAVRDLGYSVEEASAATGLTVAEIATILARPLPPEDLDYLASER